MSNIFKGAGYAMQAASQVQQAGINAAQAEVTGESYLANANLATMQAEATKKAGAYEEAKLAREKAKSLGTQKALYAKSGVLFSQDSPLLVLADTATQYEMDIAANRYNTAVKTGQLEYESEYKRRMGEYYKGPLSSAYKKAGYLQAGATLLTGAGDIIAGMEKSAAMAAGGA